MKKILALLCAVVIMLSFAACSSEPCEFCGSKDGTKKYTVQGESGYLCKDCGKLAEMANGLADIAK